jgi:dephospho-CoA kinase
MGKSTAAAALRRLGIPVFSSDAAVHRLLGPGGRAVGEVAAAFPAAVIGSAISRRQLAKEVFGNAGTLARLEEILHPLERMEAERFVAAARRARRPIVALDIPLLYEAGRENRVHAVVAVTAPRFVQEARVLRRPGFTRARLAAILARQLADREKRARADFVVPTGLDKRSSLRRLTQIVRMIEHRGRR